MREEQGLLSWVSREQRALHFGVLCQVGVVGG